MSRTAQGFLHIVVIVCYLTKFVVARPLRIKTSREILGCLEEIYIPFGVPKILQHGQGPEFSSRVNVNDYIFTIETVFYLHSIILQIGLFLLNFFILMCNKLQI